MTSKLLCCTAITGLLAWGVPLSANAQTTYQTADIHVFGTTIAVGGAATLTRSADAVDARIATSGLHKKAAYTVWWVVFNTPGGCVGGCGEDDLSNSSAGASVFYAAGFVTGTDGNANVGAHVNAGSLPEGFDVLIPGGLTAGNGLAAEIHLVVRSHGPIIPGRVDEQIGSFNGACEVNACVDQLAAAFLPAI